MGLIDERGRLFGRVNVIDALVVLLAVAVVAAGVALVAGGAGNPVGRSITRPAPTLTRRSRPSNSGPTPVPWPVSSNERTSR
jgi:hypothetical protein